MHICSQAPRNLLRQLPSRTRTVLALRKTSIATERRESSRRRAGGGQDEKSYSRIWHVCPGTLVELNLCFCAVCKQERRGISCRTPDAALCFVTSSSQCHSLSLSPAKMQHVGTYLFFLFKNRLLEFNARTVPTRCTSRNSLCATVWRPVLNTQPCMCL